ncbi:MAG: hypothetical protein R3335_01350, partial [Anaerolineales bacterium]|nr:hypothetical protein [Anaerolineales bacterium]
AIKEVVREAENMLEPARTELKTVEDQIRAAKGKIAQLMATFGSSGVPAVEEAQQKEVYNLGAFVESLELHRSDLLTTIATAEISPARQDEIKALAAKVRDRLEAGGSGQDREELARALDLCGELIIQDREYWARLTCGLREKKLVCIRDHSCA